MFAPKGEKELYKAIKAKDVKAIKSVGVYYPDFRLASYSLAGLMTLDSEPTEAEQLLSEPSQRARTRRRTSSFGAIFSRDCSCRSPGA
jgi:hypothetical protein